MQFSCPEFLQTSHWFICAVIASGEKGDCFKNEGLFRIFCYDKSFAKFI